MAIYSGQSLVNIMDYCIDIKQIPEIHKRNLKSKIVTDNLYTHPNDLLIGYNYMTDKQYAKIASDLYGLPIDVLPVDKIYDIVEELLASRSATESNVAEFERDLLVNSLDLNLYPLGTSKNNPDSLFWIFKEPNHVNEVNPYSEHKHLLDTDNDYLKDILEQSTLFLGYSEYSFVVLSNSNWNAVVRHVMLQYPVKLPMPEPIDLKYALLAHKLIIDALHGGASDLFFASDIGGIRFEYMVLNDIVVSDIIPADRYNKEVFLSELYAMAGISKEALNKKIVRNYAISNLGTSDYRGRMNLIPDEDMDSVSIRVIPEKSSYIPFDVLKIRPSIKKIIKDCLDLNSSGLVVMAGATGSGKSTTIRGLLGYLKESKPTKRIVSVEAPKEAEIPGVAQISLDNSSTISIDDVLEALTRCNPKILNVNEINNEKLINFTIQSCLQRLQVITSLHTDTVYSIPNRILGMSSEYFREFLEVSLLYLHQTMLKELCPICREKVYLNSNNEKLNNILMEVLEDYNYGADYVWFSVEGNTECEHCHGRGVILNSPVVCVGYYIMLDKDKRLMRRMASYEIGIKIREIMMSEGTTGLHDGLQYLIEGKVDFLQVAESFGMVQKYRIDHRSDELSAEEIARTKQ